MLKLDEIEESKLIKGLRTGDQTAFEILFRFYYPGLVVYASQFVINRDEATEIVQDFFVRLWENRSSVKASSSLKSYFFTSVKNSSFNYLKHQEVKRLTIQKLERLTDGNLLFEPDLYVKSELQEKIKVAVDKLPARCKEVFVLSRFQGLSNDEIATKLELSKRTVETQISNALKILRVELKEYLGLLFLLGIINF